MEITKNHKNRKEITSILSLSLEKHINPKSDTRIYYAKEVTFDYATRHSFRVDFMQFKPKNNSVSGIEKGDFYCFEIKSSIDDFRSKNGHNFIGDYNYYIMPQEVYEIVKKEIPYFVGVYIPISKNHTDEWYILECIKKARKQDRTRPIYEMLFMMLRSSSRDILKEKGIGKQKTIIKKGSDIEKNEIIF